MKAKLIEIEQLNTYNQNFKTYYRIALQFDSEYYLQYDFSEDLDLLFDRIQRLNLLDLSYPMRDWDAVFNQRTEVCLDIIHINDIENYKFELAEMFI